MRKRRGHLTERYREKQKVLKKNVKKWAYDDERIDDFSFGLVTGLGQALAT
jgi:hypothetical protein